MKHHIFSLFLSILFPLNIFACSCYCGGDCSFSKTIEHAEIVALVKVISFSDSIPIYDEMIPLVMTLEIVKKYKGAESKKQIRLWGDNGMFCRPYNSNFKLGEYYLIAPDHQDSYSFSGKPDDYCFSTCSTDYLKVDTTTNIAYGEYSRVRKNQVTLNRFEKNLNSIFMDYQLFLMYFMAAFYIFAGVSHFRIPKFFLAITPKWLPYTEKVNILVGVIEVALGISLLIPITQSIAAYLIIALLVAVFPANFYHFQKAREKGKGVVGTAIRLPIQLLLIYWAYQYT